MSFGNQTTSLPTVDISRFHGQAAERAAFIVSLREILHDCGFFYLIGHGVSEETTQRVLNVSRAFFALPEKDKLAIEMVKTPRFRGYNRAGFELTGGKQDWREQVDFDTEGETQELSEDDPLWKRVLGPNQWPDALPDLRSVILDYQAEVTRVAKDVLGAIATALGQPENVFAPIFDPHPAQHLKILRYPGKDQAASEQGVGAHKDGGLVTILLNDEVAGLKVRTEAGDWIDAPPLAGAFIVNTGELLELVTNGFVRADVHAVVTPPAGVERYSVVFFLGAYYGAKIPPLDLPEGIKLAERGVTVDPQNPILNDVGANHLKARLRSHPDVARAHYSGLTA
ncbi:isopenicillin N synthase family oxygenase [Bradyrhizobium commune]|uniref:Isopenicillin N synthase family oxygenase n=2 Tax=Bradyrhizobium commune TaxID=83627 RepID=A0A7S9DD34_9BRAD|nr:isopenicillin N synthase family oxygenase [Bradyrhizobium commune]